MSGGSHTASVVGRMLDYDQQWSELLNVTSFRVNEALGVKLMLRKSLGRGHIVTNSGTHKRA